MRPAGRTEWQAGLHVHSGQSSGSSEYQLDATDMWTFVIANYIIKCYMETNIKSFHIDYMLRARGGWTAAMFEDTVAISHTGVWNEIYRRDRAYDGSCASIGGLL